MAMPLPRRCGFAITVRIFGGSTGATNNNSTEFAVEVASFPVRDVIVRAAIKTRCAANTKTAVRYRARQGFDTSIDKVISF
jgi:hypothetical protein